MLFFIAILAYIIPITAWMAKRAGHLRNRLLPLMRHAQNAAAVEFDRRPLCWQLAIACMGLVLGVMHTLFINWFDGLDFSPGAGRISLVIVAGNLLVWTTVSTAMAYLFWVAARFWRLAKEIPVDLFQLHLLGPFARIATASMLVLVGAQAALPLMLIQGFSLAGFLPGWLAIFVPMVILMAMPVWPIHQAIVVAKTAELSRVNEAISARHGTTSAALADRLDLVPLLQYRREIQALSEWPFDIGFFARLSCYLLIPPLTWVGAALIERLVETLL